MASTGSLVDLLLFYTTERALFNRMVISMGKNPNSVKKVMAFWFLLEELGLHNLIRTINSQDHDKLEALFNVALQLLRKTQIDACESNGPIDVGLLQGLLVDQVKCGVLCYDHGFLHRRYVHIMETVCNKIFGENGAIEINDLANQSYPSTSIVSSETQPYTSDLVGSLGLNLNASNLRSRPTQDETKTMFLTFSNGHPLAKEEIVNFFTTNWGEVIEDVFIEKTSGKDPLFGKMVFTNASVIAQILNGQTKAKFLVNGKHLWARMFVSRNGRSITMDGNN